LLISVIRRIFAVRFVAEQKQVQLLTTFLFLWLSIALNSYFPPGLPLFSHWSPSQNFYASNYAKYLWLCNKTEPRISILLTTNRLSLRIWLQGMLFY